MQKEHLYSSIPYIPAIGLFVRCLRMSWSSSPQKLRVPLITLIVGFPTFVIHNILASDHFVRVGPFSKAVISLRHVLTTSSPWNLMSFFVLRIYISIRIPSTGQVLMSSTPLLVMPPHSGKVNWPERYINSCKIWLKYV